MVDFDNQTRKRCRNPKCKMKLPEPTSNAREAFCCRSCYQSFFLHRCIVCEGAIGRTTANRKICKKSKCWNALKAGLGFGRYHGNPTQTYQSLKNPELMQETAAAQQVSSASKPVERAYGPWRQIAGRTLPRPELRLAACPPRSPSRLLLAHLLREFCRLVPWPRRK
jgi:hypothetical protein